jgi:hypothetical protein
MGQAMHFDVTELFARVGDICESHDLVLVADDVHTRDVAHQLDPARFATMGRKVVVPSDQHNLASCTVRTYAGEFLQLLSGEQHEPDTHMRTLCEVAAVDDERWIPLDDVVTDAYEGADDVHAALVLAVRAHGAVGVIPEMGVGEVGYFHVSEGDDGSIWGTRTFFWPYLGASRTLFWAPAVFVLL